jgi:hypothetical protein
MIKYAFCYVHDLTINTLELGAIDISAIDIAGSRT